MCFYEELFNYINGIIMKGIFMIKSKKQELVYIYKKKNIIKNIK